MDEGRVVRRRKGLRRRLVTIEVDLSYKRGASEPEITSGLLKMIEEAGVKWFGEGKAYGVVDIHGVRLVGKQDKEKSDGST